MIVQLILILIFVAFFASIWPEIPRTRGAKLVYLLLGIIVTLYVGFRDGDLVRDYGVYKAWYEQGFFLAVEPTFALIAFFVKNYLWDNVLFLFVIYAIIAVALKWKAIEQFTSLVFFSILIYLSDLFILQELTQMRAAAATGFFLLSIKPLYERKGKKFLFLIVCATLFHISSVLAFFLWFLKPEKINKPLWIFFVLTAYGLALLHFDLFQLAIYMPIPFVQEKVTMYLAMQEKSEGGANIFSLLFLGKMAITLFLLWKAEFLATHNRYIYLLLKIMFVSLLFLLLFSSNLAAGLRFSEFFGTVEILLFPLLYYTMKQKYIAWAVLVFIAALFFYIRVFKFELILPVS